MAEWLGELMANWPLWALIVGVSIAVIGWCFYYLVRDDGWPLPIYKKEWWQDREKRLAKARTTKVMKQKKG